MTLRETKKYLERHLGNSKKEFGHFWDLGKWRYVELLVYSADICYCIKEVVDKQVWVVFTTERRYILLDIALYTSESEACAEFINEVREAYKDDWKD